MLYVKHEKLSELTSCDILRYMKQCKDENRYLDNAVLYIYLNNADDRYGSNVQYYEITWPDINEIKAIECENIAVCIICDDNYFKCSNMAIYNYNDSYLDNNIDYVGCYNTIKLENVKYNLVFDNCYMFYTDIEIMNSIEGNIIIKGTSYINKLYIVNCGYIDFIYMKEGSFIDELMLYRTIVNYGIYTCVDNNDDDFVIGSLALTKSIIVDAVKIYGIDNCDIDPEFEREIGDHIINSAKYKKLKTEYSVICYEREDKEKEDKI